MSNLNAFAKFGNYPKKFMQKVTQKVAVAYTRVSTKEQADNNLSLETQRKTIDQYSERNKVPIVAYFGGSHESAKTDGRKEFQRMLDYIKKNRGKVRYIYVYALDRFSRTGGAAIKLKDDLREEYGVLVDAVTQPADTSSPSGVLQQDVQLIFSHHDNQMRRLRAITGMKAKFEKGIWITRPPQGYDIVRINNERKLVVNETGKKLRKAFMWKAGGMKNEEILVKLKTMGIPMYKQQLTKIFKRPFYCGLINHGLLEGEIVEGTHEKLVSREVFLKVNDINEQNTGYGVPHKKEQDEVPLKVFIKCDACNQPFTGYVVKTKNLWYYKCRTTGCKCNKSAKTMHNLFADLLSQYEVREEFAESLQLAMVDSYHEMTKENAAQHKILKLQLAEIEKKLDNIKEKYYGLNKMNEEDFDKFSLKYNEELEAIKKELEKTNCSISNLEEKIASAINLSTKLNTVWHSSDTTMKEKLQKLLFPDGIVYDRKIEAFRTGKVNIVFAQMAHLQRELLGKEKGTNHTCDDLSLLAG